MTKEEIRAKYSRIPTDFSQIQMLKDQLLASGILDVAQVNPENAGKAIVFDETGALVVGDAIPSGGSVSIAGTSLIIPESTEPGPEPIVTIDGVDYYHKQEFDLTTGYPDIETTDSYQYDLLTGEKINASTTKSFFSKGILPQDRHYLHAQLYLAFGFHTYAFNVKTDSPYSPVDYTSRAFTVVDSIEQVSDYTKICLPGCSAFYGWLSEDGNTFISYYNLKNDGAPTKIDSVKQGNAVIPLAVPSGEAASGTVLTADGQGGAAFAALPQGGGTQLYLHTLTIPYSKQLKIVSTSSAKYTTATDIVNDYYSNDALTKILAWTVVIYTGLFATTSRYFVNHMQSTDDVTLQFSHLIDNGSTASFAQDTFDVSSVSDANYEIVAL